MQSVPPGSAGKAASLSFRRNARFYTPVAVMIILLFAAEVVIYTQRHGWPLLLISGLAALAGGLAVSASYSIWRTPTEKTPEPSASEDAAIADMHQALAGIIECVSDGLFALDSEWCFTYVNAKAANWFGQPVECLLGSNIWTVLPGALGSRFYHACRDCIANKQPVTFEAFMTRTASWYEMNAYPGNQGLSIYFRDITERKRDEMEHIRLLAGERSARRALYHANETLRAIIEASPLPVIAMDIRENVTEWNLAAERLFGWTKNEVVGQPFPLAPPDSPQLSVLCKRLLTGEVIDSIVVRWQHKSGALLDLSMSAAPLRDATGDVCGNVCILADVTERSRFLRIATHELRNPLAAIRGLISLLLYRISRGADLTNIDHLLSMANQEICRLSYLLNEVFEAFRTHEGHLQLKFECINAVALCRSVVEVIRTTAANHSFTINAETENLLVLGDVTRLEQVLHNLLNNAVKYSPPDSEIQVVVNEENNQLRISVQDQGRGIPRAEQVKVFETFYRASNLGHNDPGGMGLGLYICRDIVERHGGRIWVESEEGRGSTFVVLLPIYHENVEQSAAADVSLKR